VVIGIIVRSIVGFILLCYVLNRISYGYLKARIIRKRRWGLNICCGKTDGGGVNADIVKHEDLPNFRKISQIYDLPFEDRTFRWVLCSHTVEHLDDPEKFDRELRRVGRNVLYILPPLWDLSAAFNLLEHKWIFLTLKKGHLRLPRYVKLPFARTLQRLLGQKIAA